MMSLTCSAIHIHASSESASYASAPITLIANGMEEASRTTPHFSQVIANPKQCTACDPRRTHSPPSFAASPVWQCERSHVPSTVGAGSKPARVLNPPIPNPPLRCMPVFPTHRYSRIMRVSRGVECGSHAAAPAVLTIRRGLQRTPVPVRAPDDGDG